MTLHILLIIAIVLGVIFTARFLERTWPIATLPQSDVLDDWKAVLANLTLFLVTSPIALVSSAFIVNKFGGSLIHLPTNGAWWFVTLIALFLVNDLYRYWQHRLEHMIPVLWAMHSFHHSANAVTLVTGARHLWLEKLLTGALFPILPIIFYIPADMASIIGVLLFLPDGCAHLNVRFPMGRALTWINNPQWHRIHHSVEMHHRDKNFSGGLLIWDFLFGTAYVPAINEYPDTGLVPDEHVDVIDSIIWPVRHWRRRPVTAANN